MKNTKKQKPKLTKIVPPPYIVGSLTINVLSDLSVELIKNGLKRTTTVWDFCKRMKAEASEMPIGKKAILKYLAKIGEQQLENTKQKSPTTKKAVRDSGKSIKRTNRVAKKNKKSETKK